jgi:hypothetical protein
MSYRIWVFSLGIWLTLSMISAAQSFGIDQAPVTAADMRPIPEELTIVGRPNFWREQRKTEALEFQRLDRLFGARERRLDVIGRAMAGDGGVLCQTCTLADYLTKEAVRGRTAW